jgi:hypothetical protein
MIERRWARRSRWFARLGRAVHGGGVGGEMSHGGGSRVCT